ncbi:MAG: hypothetical protein ACXAAQ_07155, partial [Candidatus Thorarchaeota archaeon]
FSLSLLGPPNFYSNSNWTYRRQQEMKSTTQRKSILFQSREVPRIAAHSELGDQSLGRQMHFDLLYSGCVHSARLGAF